MPAILILTGVDLEARRLARLLELPALPALGFPAFDRGGVRVAAVGPGAGLLPARWPSLLADLDRPTVVSAGVCGGLDPALAAGDLVLPEGVRGPAGDLANVTPSRHRQAIAAAPGAATGLMVTARQVLETPEAKAALFAETGAVAVDMESSAILGAAAAAGLPSLVVRGVSDDARQGMPRELIELISPEGRLRLGRAVALLSRPAVLSRAVGLGRATTRALRSVARLLASITG